MISEEIAVKLAYKEVRNAAVDFMNKRGQSTLARHFGEHDAEFGFKTDTQYLNAARGFLTRNATKTTQAVPSAEGTYFRCNTVTNEFEIINKFGGIST